jgi:hypothetical protein
MCRLGLMPRVDGSHKPVAVELNAFLEFQNFEQQKFYSSRSFLNPRPGSWPTAPTPGSLVSRHTVIEHAGGTTSLLEEKAKLAGSGTGRAVKATSGAHRARRFEKKMLQTFSAASQPLPGIRPFITLRRSAPFRKELRLIHPFPLGFFSLASSFAFAFFLFCRLDSRKG